MLKHTSLIVAGALVLGMGISTVSFAEMPSLDSQSYTRPGSIRSEERRVGKECRSRWSPYH